MQRTLIRALCRATSAFALGWALAVGQVLAFGFDDVAREADRLARAPYRKPPAADPALTGMSYDAYRQQRFRPRSLPAGAAWARHSSCSTFPSAAASPARCRCSSWWATKCGRCSCRQPRSKTRPSAGIAGWRLNRWIDQPRRSDEVSAFLGASYFRLGRRRGCATACRPAGWRSIRSAAAARSFPTFSTYWVRTPESGRQRVALLRVARVPARDRRLRLRAAAGRIDHHGRGARAADLARAGGEPRDCAADEHVSCRRDPAHGRRLPPRSARFRWPASGQRQRRVAVAPADQPAQACSSAAFAMPSLRGFGLMQRDRAFTSYHDLEARYELRPSAWVEPIGDWGPGRVELLQFNTPDETHDNIGAWWFPDRLPPPGEAIEFAWRVTVSDRQPLPPGAWVVQKPPRPRLPRRRPPRRPHAVPDRLRRPGARGLDRKRRSRRWPAAMPMCAACARSPTPTRPCRVGV